MDFSVSTELEAIADAARTLVSNFDDDYWLARDEAKEFPWDFYNVFADAGWLGIMIPEAYGGAGLDVMSAGTLLREVAIQ